MTHDDAQPDSDEIGAPHLSRSPLRAPPAGDAPTDPHQRRARRHAVATFLNLYGRPPT